MVRLEHADRASQPLARHAAASSAHRPTTDAVGLARRPEPDDADH